MSVRNETIKDTILERWDSMSEVERKKFKMRNEDIYDAVLQQMEDRRKNPKKYYPSSCDYRQDYDADMGDALESY